MYSYADRRSDQRLMRAEACADVGGAHVEEL